MSDESLVSKIFVFAEILRCVTFALKIIRPVRLKILVLHSVVRALASQAEGRGLEIL